ncbi:hypothetical protein CEXT_50621 [Caerostris extrusa]|uniref:Uncharacterized protein n=1 Tax=Caerostris extrusa TaxID=172846 RepID=A0AAV4X365_CAEEX|nr:hypothetical protein CEXT_50621 [Caerostris extrusa]
MKLMKKGRNRQKMAQIRAEEAARFEDDCCDHVLPLQVCFVLNSITQSGSEDVNEKQQISVKHSVPTITNVNMLKLTTNIPVKSWIRCDILTLIAGSWEWKGGG